MKTKITYDEIIYTCRVCGNGISTTDEDESVQEICPDCLDDQAMDFGFYDDDYGA